MQTQMEWATFPGRPYGYKAAENEVRVTMRPDATFYLNAKAHAALGHPKHVELLYDAARRTIGIKPGNPDAANTFRLVDHAGRGKYRRINAAAFCRHFRIRTDRTILFHAATMDNDNVLHLDLTQTVAVSRGAR